MLIHKGTVPFDTDRLHFRKFSVSDADDMFNNWSKDTDVTRYLSWKAHDSVEVTKNSISRWIQSYEKLDNYHWAIVLKETVQVIGSISVVDAVDEHKWCEIGYCIGKSFWGKGVMTEALTKVIDFLFAEVGFNRIQALHHSENINSGKVMIKAGMKNEGILREYHLNNQGNFVDCTMYSILRNEWIYT